MESTVMKFKPGQIVATPGALEALERNDSKPAEFLARHFTGDWGEVCEEDKQANEDALVDGSRLLSSYSLPDRTRIWIITDAVIDAEDVRNSTTLLLPEEY